MHLKFQLSFASVMLMKYAVILFWENGKIVYAVDECRLGMMIFTECTSLIP